MELAERRFRAAVRRLPGAVTLLLAVGLMGCGGDSTSTTTVPVGDAEIELETHDADSPAQVARGTILAVLEQSGFPAGVVDCYERELEKVPDTELVAAFEEAEAQGSDTAAALRAIRPIKKELTRVCFTDEALAGFGPADLDEDNAAVLKQGFINQLQGRLLADLPPGPRDCVVAKVEELSPRAFLQLIQSTPREIGQAFAQYGRDCRT
jgi:hypothetical protein